MKIVVAGDFCDRYRVSDQINRGEFASMFDSVKPIIQEADQSFVNFEFPIVEKIGEPIGKCGPNLKGSVRSIEAIKYAGFTVCTLANNHILDQGESCCVDTMQALSSSGLKIVGCGRSLSEASTILYISQGEETLAVINCCEHEFTIAEEKSAGANPLNPIQQFYKIQEAKKNADYVIVIVHGGAERYQLPSLRMKETYRFFIDAGADAVVNHHQHCYSGYEQYCGKPIFYGIGNFCFDNGRQTRTDWNEGFLLAIKFCRDENPDFSIHPYIQCVDNASVTLMNNSDKELFERKIIELNSIIDDDGRLRQEYEEWVKDTARGYNLLFQPYYSKLSRKLYLRNLLPTILPKNMIYNILNYINCESHLDKLRVAISNNLKKK